MRNKMGNWILGGNSMKILLIFVLLVLHLNLNNNVIFAAKRDRKTPTSQSHDVINFQEFEETLIFDSVTKQKTPLKKIAKLFQECQETSITQLIPDGLLHRLLYKTIHRLGWYNVLQSYQAANDPDFTYLRFLAQSNYEKTDLYGNSMLHILCTQSQNIGALKFILKILNTKTVATRIKLINLQNAFGNTPLHEARRANQQEIVDWLLQIPYIDVRIINHFGQPASNHQIYCSQS